MFSGRGTSHGNRKERGSELEGESSVEREAEQMNHVVANWKNGKFGGGNRAENTTL